MVVCGDSAAFVVAEIPPAVAAAFVVDVGVIRETVVAGDLVVIIVDGVNKNAGGSEGLKNVIIFFSFYFFYFYFKNIYLEKGIHLI